MRLRLVLPFLTTEQGVKRDCFSRLSSSLPIVRDFGLFSKVGVLLLQQDCWKEHFLIFPRGLLSLSRTIRLIFKGMHTNHLGRIGLEEEPLLTHGSLIWRLPTTLAIISDSVPIRGFPEIPVLENVKIVNLIRMTYEPWTFAQLILVEKN